MKRCKLIDGKEEWGRNRNRERQLIANKEHANKKGTHKHACTQARAGRHPYACEKHEERVFIWQATSSMSL